MQYGKPAGVAGGVVSGNAALAFTGFASLLWAELAVVLIVAGVIALRVGTMRRRAR